MDKRTTIVGIVIFVLIVAGMFVFASIKKTELQGTQPNTEPQVDATIPGPYDYIERVDAKHYFIDGEHTLVGDLLLPTACDLLNWDTLVAESFPEQVRIEFAVINNSDDCESTMTLQRFKVSFSASEEASITARLMGRNIEINLIPAGEGESPDDFELFIKG